MLVMCGQIVTGVAEAIRRFVLEPRGLAVGSSSVSLVEQQVASKSDVA